jgi:hypothetical protein
LNSYIPFFQHIRANFSCTKAKILVPDSYVKNMESQTLEKI